MYSRSLSRSFPNANAIAIFFCLCVIRAASAELVATSQRLVQVGERFQALCHYDREDVGRFLYWTIHYTKVGDSDREFKANFGGVDLTTCPGFTFDASNAVIASEAGLHGLTGQITCGFNDKSMGLHINNVRPEYNRIRFSCNSDRNTSNEVTLMVGKPRLLTLEIEATADGNHTAVVSTALRATCRVDKSLNPKFLYWATSDIVDTKNQSTLGGMVVEFCYRYKVRGVFDGRVNFNCCGPPDVSSTLTVKSLPVGTAIFCYVSKKNSGASALRVESNRLVISGSGRFTKVSISSKSSSVLVGGKFYAKCRLLSSEFYYDRIMWKGFSKFGERVHITNSKGQKESSLVIEPIYATDNQSQISCGIDGEPATKSERIIIRVKRKVETSLSILRNESTMEPVPLNGTFRAVCSYKEIDTKTVHWVVTADHVTVGRVNISHDVCRTNIMITNAVTASRVQLSCNLTAKTTTFSVEPVKIPDAGTEIYCTAVDQFGQTVRSESLSIMTHTHTANTSLIAKTRPNYTEATLAASCPFGNGTEHVFMIQQTGQSDSGSDEIKAGSWSALILHDRYCSVIDFANNLPQRFFVDCRPDSKTYTLIIDPVSGNNTDFRVTCAWYANFASSNASSASEKEVLLQKSQVPQVVFPVSKPVLNYSGDMIKINDTADVLTGVWLIPAVPNQDLEFACTAGISQSSNFNLSLIIQTDEDYSYRYHGETKTSNDSKETFIIRRKLRVKTTYQGVFCVAENIVSRWESDFVRILHSYSSVFVALDGWTLPDSSFSEWRKIRTLKMCHALCEVNGECQSVGYNYGLCYLSSRGFNDSQLSTYEGFNFHQRLPREDILERNNFWSDVYVKHENRSLPFRGDIDIQKGLSVTQCQRRCSKLLPCRSIQFRKNRNICHLSSMTNVSIHAGIGRYSYNWDVYTKNNSPGSFIAIRGLIPDVDSKPVTRFSPSGSGEDLHLLMQCADFCRNRSDCVSFVSTFEENKNSMVCLGYDVNIPELRLVDRVKSNLEGSFYARVRSLNSELLPVHRLQETEKYPIS